MKASLVSRAVGLGAVAVIGLAACGTNSNGGSTGGGSNNAGGCPSGSLSGQGSTFQQNIEKQWISQYEGQCSGAQITYTGTGSGAGIQQFGSGTIDFAGSDAVMKTDEQTAADKRCGGKAIHIPITAGGVAIIYNIPGANALQLSAATLAGIFEDKIKTWNDPKIKADNPGVNLPSTGITPYHRSDSSGTTKVFSSFLDSTAKSVWSLGADKELNWPAGSQGANGSDGVTAGVKQTKGGITYAEVSYAQQNNLPTAKIKGSSSYVAISSDSVSQSIDSGFSVSGTAPDLSGSLDFTKMTGYPISTVSYVIVCSHYSDAAKSKLLKGYLGYAIGSGQSQASQLGFAPLPSALVTKAQASIASIG